MSSPNVGRVATRIERALASPLGVLISLPLLIVAVGVTILLVGRSASSASSQAMARRQLVEQAAEVQSQVVFALDQAAPLLERLRQLADPTRDRDDVLLRLHDLLIGRPGVAYASISFPDGTFRGAYLTATQTIEVQESRVTPDGATAAHFSVAGAALVPQTIEHNAYDPRTRSFYQLARARRARSWTEPYIFFRSKETGISCAEPIFDAHGNMQAVIAVDFDVSTLSRFVSRAAFEGSRSIVYTRDGSILVYPHTPPNTKLDASVPAPAVASTAQSAGKAEGTTATSTPLEKPPQAADIRDPALVALLAREAQRTPREQIFFDLNASDETYLASVTPIGGKRADIPAALDWYVATIVPAKTVLGPTIALQRSNVIVSAFALVVAIALGILLAWNLLRMRRQVVASREQARTAEARARELGSYRLVRRLGEGGMGEVWRAEHRLLARQAAIKLIRSDALTEPAKAAEHRERFRREAQTLASMKSRHTIDIFDYGVSEDGVFYYVMELLEGLDFESLVRTQGAQPAARVIKFISQACGSLAEAHDARLLHRDIKPPNLFVTRAADEVDIVKLLDFGIVQSVGDSPLLRRARLTRPPLLGGVSGTPTLLGTASPAHGKPPVGGAIGAGLAGASFESPSASTKLTQLDAMIGTPGFMAPEQIQGAPLDGRADLYSLGCVAWWLLTATEIFSRKEGPLALLERHLHEPPPRLRDHREAWFPPALEEVLLTCLAKDARDRPADARALAAQLRAIEIPVEHAWTDAHAFAWWASLRQIAPEEMESTARVLVAEQASSDVATSVDLHAASDRELAFGPTRLG